MDKKVKILLLSISITLLVAIISTSYAYFTISNKTGSEETITSGTMALTLHDGSKIETNFMIPGEYIEKTFYVTNTGSLATSYDIYLSEVINDFADKTDLVYTLTSSDGGYSTPSQVQVPSASAKIVDNQAIGTSTTHHYTLRITFLNKNEAQDDNQGKHFSGKIQINEYTDVNSGNVDTFEGCPGVGCKYLYTTDSFAYAEEELFEEVDRDLTFSQEMEALLKDDYHDVINYSGKNYFLGIKYNSETRHANRAYACGITNGDVFCMEGSDDGSTYEPNSLIISTLFGEYDEMTNTGCQSNDNYIACNDGNIIAHTLIEGYAQVSKEFTSKYCAVDYIHGAGCWDR